jgi:hypothetical protein
VGGQKMKSKDCLGIVAECADCGSPVLEYLCNQSLLEARPESKDFDYWLSCSNILCKNHNGEGYFMNFPEWADEK